jgi:nucleoside-diphosphate-sugar epimerase
MSSYLIVGAGTIGTLVAEQLASQGHRAVVASRGGRGAESPGVEHVAVDASDSSAIASLATGVSAIFNCANPAYHRWPTDWPPIAASLLAGAESSGATLVTLNNLYAYGEVTAPMTTDTPLSAGYEKARVRKRMWTEALAAHEAGRVRATEVRASDFIGPRAQGMFGLRVVPRILAGKSCQVLGSLDQPHSWTFVDDVARTLITCAQNSEAWGRAWHVSTNPARTQREVIDDLADVAGVAHVKASVIPLPVLRLMGVFNPLIRELPKTLYQFTSPFVIDDAMTRTELGIQPTPWRTVLQSTVDAYRAA